MPDPIDRHASRFPGELAAGIEGLDNKRKRAIFALLFDEPGLSFTEIRNELSGEEVLASESLSTSLTELKEAGLINKQVRGVDDDSRFTSAYSVSAFGELFFRSLLSALGTEDGEPAEEDTADVPATDLEDQESELSNLGEAAG